MEIEPAVVTKFLPAGTNYINMSCCANLGFRGYYNLLDFMADRNPSTRYLILHFTPYTMPLPQTWDSDGAALWGIPDVKVFGDAVYDAFLSPWRAMFHIPSLAFRRQVTDNVFYIHGLLNQLDRPLLNNVNYLEFLRVFRDAHGWMRDRIPGWLFHRLNARHPRRRTSTCVPFPAKPIAGDPRYLRRNGEAA